MYFHIEKRCGMRLCLAILGCFFLYSCNFIEKPETSVTKLYNESLNTINWRTVDRIPLFNNCDEMSAKTKQDSCFNTNLQRHMQAYFSQKEIAIHTTLSDTIWFYLQVLPTGNWMLDSIQMPAKVKTQLPMFNSWASEAVKNLPTVSPAQKRGVPVSVQFRMPLVFKTLKNN